MQILHLRSEFGVSGLLARAGKIDTIVWFLTGVGIYFSLDSKTHAYGVLRASFALNLRRKGSKGRPLVFNRV